MYDVVTKILTDEGRRTMRTENSFLRYATRAGRRSSRPHQLLGELFRRSSRPGGWGHWRGLQSAAAHTGRRSPRHLREVKQVDNLVETPVLQFVAKC